MQILIQTLFSVSLLGFVINLILGYSQLHLHHLAPIHMALGLGSTFIGVLVTQMSTSYYLGTRDQLIEEDRISKIDSKVIEKAKQIKKNLFASCGPAMILILLNAILAGCAYAKIIPSLPHHVTAYLVVMSHARAFKATRDFHRFRKYLLE